LIAFPLTVVVAVAGSYLTQCARTIHVGFEPLSMAPAQLQITGSSPSITDYRIVAKPIM